MALCSIDFHPVLVGNNRQNLFSLNYHGQVFNFIRTTLCWSVDQVMRLLKLVLQIFVAYVELFTLQNLGTVVSTSDSPAHLFVIP